MPKRVPQYLKEISTSLSGQQQGDYASEWDPSTGVHSYSDENNYNNQDRLIRARSVRDFARYGNYLGWWGRNGRGVYYFGEHQRPKYFTNPESYYWDAYDWYKDAAYDINNAFEYEERARKLIKEIPNIFSTERAKTAMSFLPVYSFRPLTKPDTIRNINGIYAWLQQKYQPTEKFLNEYNAKAEKFNEEIKAFDKARAEEQRIELENKKKAKEDERYNTIVTHLGELRGKISKLHSEVMESKYAKNKEFSLFKSELTSKIGDPNLKVSRVEHDEDIAQLNETIQAIKKKDIPDLMAKGKNTDDSIALLQKQINLSMGDNYSKLNLSISGVKGSVGSITEELNRTKEEQKRTAEKQQEDIQQQAKTSGMLLREQQAQSDKIANLRQELQALGGKAKEFIDNTKRREMALKARVPKKESVVTRVVKRAAFPDLTKRPWLKESVTGRFFQLANQW